MLSTKISWIVKILMVHQNLHVIYHGWPVCAKGFLRSDAYWKRRTRYSKINWIITSCGFFLFDEGGFWLWSFEFLCVKKWKINKRKNQTDIFLQLMHVVRMAYKLTEGPLPLLSFSVASRVDHSQRHAWIRIIRS